MSSLDRCLTVLQGGKPDQIPVVPQTFMFSLQTVGMRMRDVVRCAGKMAEAQQVSMEKYGYDGCVIDFDDATLAEACGARVIFRDDEPAVVDESEPKVKDYRDIDSFRLPNPWRDGRLPIWLEATRLLVERVGREAFVMGRADQGPFTLACQLRGPQQFMMDLASMEDAEPIHRLIEYCRQACTLFAKAQKDSGAHATSIGDAYASPNLISPAMFRRFALWGRFARRRSPSLPKRRLGTIASSTRAADISIRTNSDACGPTGRRSWRSIAGVWRRSSGATVRASSASSAKMSVARAPGKLTRSSRGRWMG